MTGPPALVHDGRAAFAGVHRSVLLTGFQSGVSADVAVALLVATALLYILGRRRLLRRGRTWPLNRTVCFVAGLALVWVAVGSGLAAYDESNVTLHVVQHWLLMMVAPPLLALGQPVLLAAQSSRRSNQVRLTRTLRSRPVAIVTHPLLAGLLYIGTMFVLFVDRAAYDYVVAHPLVHDASHVALLVFGLLYWQPLIGLESARRLPAPLRMLGIMLAMPLEGFVGVWLMISPRPIDAINSLADTQTAGKLFLFLATLSGGLWAVVVAAQWYAQAVREDRRVTERSEAEGWAWTVPWWEQAADGAAAGPAAAGHAGRDVSAS